MLNSCLYNTDYTNDKPLSEILTHLTYRANAKKHVISNNNVTVLKARTSRRQLLLQNDVSHGVGWCMVVFTLERCYKYTEKHVTQSNYWQDSFSAMAESWEKVKTSNVFLSFIVC